MSLFCHFRGHEIRIKVLATGSFLKAPKGLFQAISMLGVAAGLWPPWVQDISL